MRKIIRDLEIIAKGDKTGHKFHGNQYVSGMDINEYMESKYKEYGGKNNFLSSQEYREAYPKIMAEHKTKQVNSNTETAKKAQVAMKEVGVKIGDNVVYDRANPFGQVFSKKGVIVDRDGIPHVKIKGEKAQVWHKGWIKDA